MADDGLVPVGRSEMYQGIDEIPDRSLRMRNVECSLNGVMVVGSDGGGILLEEGCSVTTTKDGSS